MSERQKQRQRQTDRDTEGRGGKREREMVMDCSNGLYVYHHYAYFENCSILSSRSWRYMVGLSVRWSGGGGGRRGRGAVGGGGGESTRVSGRPICDLHTQHLHFMYCLLMYCASPLGTVRRLR